MEGRGYERASGGERSQAMNDWWVNFLVVDRDREEEAPGRALARGRPDKAG
jgi:hypothetical protein